MLVRCAYYIGTVAPEDKERFDRYVEEVHLPDVATWPRLKGLRLLRSNGEAYEGEPARYYQCFELSFESREDMDFCMASEARKRTRANPSRTGPFGKTCSTDKFTISTTRSKNSP